MSPSTEGLASLPGIHHVTAIARDPGTNLAFYGGVLGLRLVKRTVNFDDPGTYHLYYGDGEGNPGTILTFFPWPGARPGVAGTGAVASTCLAVPDQSLGWWHQRLQTHAVDVEALATETGEEAIRLSDPDGLVLVLLARADAADRPPWVDGSVPEAHAIRGIAGVVLAERSPSPTASHLEALGFVHDPVDVAGARHRRWQVGEGPSRAFVDILAQPDVPPARIAAGSVHHVAFRAHDDAHQDAWRDVIADSASVTPRLDRGYFHSMYWREPGGVLFELATDPPGFSVDEPMEALGTRLCLPAWLEGRRDEIEARLPALDPK